MLKPVKHLCKRLSGNDHATMPWQTELRYLQLLAKVTEDET